PAYAISFHGVDDRLAMWSGVVANLVFIAALPLAAMLADRVGRRVNNMVWGIGVALLAFPLSGLLDDSAISLVTAMSLALVLQSFAASTQVAWFAELFATKSRATGTGIAVSLAAAVFGGTAPYLNTWLTSRDSADLFTWYVVALALCVAVAAYFTRETKGTALTSTHVPNPATAESTVA
ncbi:MFS transporter, partial [Streptomyces koyangensis]